MGGSQMQKAGGAVTGTTTTLEETPSTLLNGRKVVAVAGTAEPLAASSVPILAVTVRALRTNTDDIYIGDSSVDSSNGHILRRGASVSIAFDNLADVYIDAVVSGEGVTFLGVDT